MRYVKLRRRFRGCPSPLLVAVLGGGLVVAPGMAIPPVGAAEVTLQRGALRVAVNPESLQVRFLAGGRPAMEISAGQAGLGSMAHLKRRADRVSWELPAKGLTVAMQVKGDTLSAHFQSRETGELTWPIVGAGAGMRAWVLPLFEGVYVPAEDATWGAFLPEREELSTTADLSMPFWGLDCGGCSLTYLLTHPFNNALTFRREAGSLSARLTHTFTRNWKVKEYGLRVSLGPASPIAPARRYRRWLQTQGQLVGMAAKIRRTPEAQKLLGAAHVYLYGDGVSPRMVEQFAASGLDRLWLGVESWQALRRHPETIRKAKERGYLIGPYDSYHSIHDPDAPPDETWETAQFDRALYEHGPVVGADGRPRAGFQKKGYSLSPQAARPYVERRVASLMKEWECNSWFIDCDAFGELFDDYSPRHPATQAEDMRARLERMIWIRDTYGLVIGSEGGSAYAASTLHFAHGMMTPIFGWGDPDLRDHNSPFWLGGYYPPDAPANAFRPVPLKPRYRTLYFDPRYRLPLYQTVFHDSLVTTHHAAFSSLKFRDDVTTVELLELLYNVPPVYKMNQREFTARKARMLAHHAFFSPLHRELALRSLMGFDWLTADRRVQRTVFGGNVELVANFGKDPYPYLGTILPGESILVRRKRTGEIRVYQPAGLPP